MNNSTGFHDPINRTAQCIMAQQLLNPYSKGIIWAECMAAALAVLPNALLVKIVWHVKVFPSNLRLLLCHFALLLLIFSVSSIVRGAYFLITAPCSFRFSQKSCRIFDLATQYLVIPNIYMALFTLCVERLHATIQYKNYDKTKKPWLAASLIIITWIVSFYVYGSDVPSLPTDRYIAMCDVTFIPFPATSGYLTLVYFVSEWLSGLITVFLYFRTRHVARNMAINRAIYDLSSRFLVDQNVQVNAVIMPWVVLHIVCHLPTLAISIFVTAVQARMPVSLETRSWLRQVTILWRLIYAVVDPLVAFSFNGHMNQHLSKSWFGEMMKKYCGIGFGRSAKVGAAGSSMGNHPTEGAIHFNQLAKIWVMPLDNGGGGGGGGEKVNARRNR